MELNKDKLHSNLVELIGAHTYSLIKRTEGKYPGEYDISKWRDKYIGATKLPKHMIELNIFKMEVDSIVGNILFLIDDAIDQP